MESVAQETVPDLLQYLWSMHWASDAWLHLLGKTNLSERVIFVIGMYLVSELWYFLVAAAYFACWYYDLLLPYRIQKTAHLPPSALIKKCVLDVCLRSAFARIPVLFFAYDTFKYFGMEINAALPSMRVILRHFLVALLFNDTVFYWSHRLLHHPRLYKHLHKKHHEFKVSISINSEYANIIEVGLCDVFATVGGCLFLGSHFLVLLSWTAIRIWETCAAHSGYALPFCPWSQIPVFNGPQVHDFHHSHNVGSYGAMTRFWDVMMGTDRAYEDWARKNEDPHIPSKAL